MTKNNKQIINILNFFKMEKNNVKEEQQFTAPVESENAAVEQQVEKKPWRKTRWGKALIAIVAIVLGVGGYVMFKKLKGSTTTETATDNAVEVEEQQKETTPRENNNRRDRFEARREKWNQQ